MSAANPRHASGAAAVRALWAKAASSLGLVASLLGVPPAADIRSGQDLPAPRFLDPSGGNVNGIAGLGMIVEREGVGALAPWGGRCHLTLHSRPDVDYIYPCGEWVAPPRGVYRFWAEFPETHEVSPGSALLLYNRAPFVDRGIVIAIPVVPGGLVALPPTGGVSPEAELRLLAVSQAKPHRFLQYEMTRRVPIREAQNGILMPEGRAVAAIWDSRSRSYLALSRPFNVLAQAMVSPTLRRPTTRSDVVVQIQLARPQREIETSPVPLALYHGGRSLPPDVVAPATDRLYAIWYDVEPGRATLSYSIPELTPARETLELAAGEIARVVTGSIPLSPNRRTSSLE